MSLPLRVLLSAVVALLLAASASSTAKIEPYTASYDFTPKVKTEAPAQMLTPEAPGAAPAAAPPAGPPIAIVAPTWAADHAYMASDPDLKEFTRSLAQDLPELFNAKKMTSVGPYAELAEMTYSEKKAAKLALVTELQVNPFCDAQPTGVELMSNGKPWNTYVFTPGVSGTVLFKVIEPLSKEVLWHQKLELPCKVGASWQAHTDGSECQGGPSGWHPQNRNEMLRALEKQYVTIFEELDARLSRATMDELVVQADEIKAKKVF